MKTLIVTLACIILGPILFCHGLSDLLTATQAKSWPTAQGIVLSSDLRTSRGHRGRMTYTPVVKYSYEVNGATFAGDRVDYGDRGFSSMKNAMAVALRYREGQQVPVHYEAKNPQSSVLEVGTTADNWLVSGLGLLITLVGAFFARGLWKEFNSNNYAPSSGF